MHHAPRLNYFTGNRLELLALRLATELGQDPLPPEIRETVLVPSRGMASWLERELARHWGIAASLDLPFPDRFLDQLAARFDLGRPAPADPFRPAAQLWQLHELFWEIQNGERQDPDLQAVATHLDGDEDGRKRYQLARRVSGLFANYQFVRPASIAAWSAQDWFGDVPMEAAGEVWQRALWRELTARNASTTPPARRLLGLVRRIARGDFEKDWLPPRLSIFGATTLPPILTQVLVALSEHVPVDLYFLVPTPGYIADLRSRRERDRSPDGSDLAPAEELVGELGKLGREFFATLLDLDPRGGAFSEAGFLDPGPHSRLHHLQSALHASGADPVQPYAFGEDDRSLQLHCCHSPLREMEVLRDEVLCAVADGAADSVSDILLLVPDIQKYAPFARSVFGATIENADGTLRLPVRIADRPEANDQPFVRLLLNWLELGSARLTLGEVFAVLHERAVRERFGFSEEDLEAIRDRLARAGVVWGEDPATRALRTQSPRFAGVSWREGLDRLLLGCFTGPVDAVVDGVLPAADATVSDTETLGRLAGALDRLFDLLASLQGPHAVAEWIARLREGLLGLTDAADERDATSRAQCLELLDRIEGDAAGTSAPVGRLAIRDLLETESGTLGTGAGFAGGMVTVAELRPMRSLPAAVIAVAGLDAESFPRPDPRDGLDLVAGDPRRGDRSPRDDDRQLFLELLLCARERLILSYVGRSEQDDHERTLSPCVQELLDTLERLGSPGIEVRHSLQPFAAIGRAETTYDHGLVRAAQALEAPRPVPAFVDASLEPPAVERIDLDDLRQFWKSPAAWFCQQAAQISLARDREEPETEALRLDGLTRWKLRDLALRSGSTALAAPAVAARMGLPAIDLIGLELDALRASAEDLEHALGFGLERIATEPVEVVGAGFAVGGALRRAPDGRVVELAAASGFRANHRVAAFVTHVVASAAALDVPTLAGPVGRPQDIETWLPVEGAAEVLAQLVEGFRRGQRAPLRFYPETSLAFAAEAADDPAEAFASARVQEAWARLAEDAHLPSMVGEKFDEAVALCTRGVENVCDAEFVDWARRFSAWLDGLGEGS